MDAKDRISLLMLSERRPVPRGLLLIAQLLNELLLKGLFCHPQIYNALSLTVKVLTRAAEQWSFDYTQAMLQYHPGAYKHRQQILRSSQFYKLKQTMRGRRCMTRESMIRKHRLARQRVWVNRVYLPGNPS